MLLDNNNNIHLAESILGLTEKNGGCTFLFNGTTNPHHGFAVAYGHAGNKFDRMPEPQYFIAVMAWFEKMGADGINTWIDNGTIYVDPIIHVHDRLMARALGYMWDEQSVFDLATKQVINLELARKM